MTITSFKFLLFVGALVVIYYAIPNKYKKFQWVVLLIANYIFYLSSGIPQIAFIISSTAITYISTIYIQKLRDDNKKRIAEKGDGITKEEKKAFKKDLTTKIKRVQYATVILHLLILAVVKYLNVTLSNVGSVLSLVGADVTMPHIDMIVPLGISFYTFASIGYIIDIGRGRYAPERNPFKVALFVSFFPCIIQGPINRFSEAGVQMFEEHHFDYDRFVKGSELILWGFFKKLVISDRAVLVVSTILDKTGYVNYSGSHFLLAATFYFIQIYTDFSGGIDISRGVAEILGIDLPLNFERPLFSKSVQEYWQRWHISLGAWMRDYVFYPIMLSKFVSKISVKLNKKYGRMAAKNATSFITTFTVFFLMAIWHGATFQYILYGFYNATVVASGVALVPVFDKMKKRLHIDDTKFSYSVFCMFRVFCLTGVSRLITHCPSLGALKFAIKSIFTNFNMNALLGLDGKFFELGLDSKNMGVLFFSLIILATVSILQENGMHIRETLNKQNIAFRWLLLIALFVIVLVFGHYGPGYDASSFIYQAY